MKYSKRLLASIHQRDTDKKKTNSRILPNVMIKTIKYDAKSIITLGPKIWNPLSKSFEI